MDRDLNEEMIRCPNCNGPVQWDGLQDVAAFLFEETPLVTKCAPCGKQYLVNVAFQPDGSAVNMMKEIPKCDRK
jgi:uncharacterized protein with PIN domain